MKLQSLLLASVVFAQTALAQTPSSAPVGLPAGSKLSPAAKRAEEAPTWTPGPAPAAAQPKAAESAVPVMASNPAAIPGTIVPATIPNTPSAVVPAAALDPNSIVAPSALNAFGSAPNSAGSTAAAPSNVQPQATSIVVPAVNTAQPPAAFTAPDDARPIATPGTEAPAQTGDQARPLQSVMIRRSAPTTSAPPANPPTEVAPARYDAPLAPAAVPAMANTTAAPANAVVPASSVAPLAIAPAATVPQTKPAIAEAPVDPEKAAAARAAAELLASSLALEKGAAPLNLLQALNQSPEPSRAAAIRNYWQLSRAWSGYHWSLDELKRLENVVPSRSAVDSPMLSTARAAAAARASDAQIVVAAAQESLARSAGLPTTNQSYFPSDVPLVGVYHTYFEVLFANRAAPGRTREIDRSLPIRLKAMNDLTAAVQSATSAVHYAEESHAKGETDMRTVLACHEALHEQRRAFLDAVLAYNADIAEYAGTVATPGTTSEKFVGMLITTKQTQRPAITTGGATGAFPAAAKSSDGWVPSAQRSPEPTIASPAVQPATATGPLGQQNDPFVR